MGSKVLNRISYGEANVSGVADDERFTAFLRFFVISLMAVIAEAVLFERAEILARETSKVFTRFKVITKMNEKSADATKSSTSVSPSSLYMSRTLGDMQLWILRFGAIQTRAISPFKDLVTNCI